MQNGYLERGDKVRVKLIRYGHPIVDAVVESVDLAHYGTMRVLHEGSRKAALYPPLEVPT